MKKTIAFLLLVTSLPLVSQADDLGVKVILEKEVAPGVYGRVEIGKDSHPDVYYQQPVIIVKDSEYASYRPIYLHVPPGHEKHWDRHCHEYRACGRNVYFIRYEPPHEHDHHDHHHEHDRHHKHDKKHGKEHKGPKH